MAILDALRDLAPFAAIAVPLLPAALVPILGLRRLVGEESEAITGALVTATLRLSFLASLILGAAWFEGSRRAWSIPLIRIGLVSGHAFDVTLLVDGLSLAMTFVTSTIALLVTRFSIRSLHRDPGFHRYFLTLALFVAGMQLLVLAGTFDLLLVGWELIGLSAVLLVAYFRHRPGAVRGGVRAMVTYRLTDVGLLFAAVVVHHTTSDPTFVAFLGDGTWPSGTSSLPAPVDTGVAFLVLVAVAGRSALLPFGGWLPRAMEGPTPASALFYGALSIHAGVYVLLRTAPIFGASPAASIAAIVLGTVSALVASAIGRVQPDARNRLAFATSAQVGLMVAAVGLHLWWWCVVHMISHACLRLHQLLRASSAQSDAEELRAARGSLPEATPSFATRLLSPSSRSRLYHLALQRFHVDELVDRLVIAPVIVLARRVVAFEDRIASLFEPFEDPESERTTASAESDGAARP